MVLVGVQLGCDMPGAGFLRFEDCGEAVKVESMGSVDEDVVGPVSRGSTYCIVRPAVQSDDGTMFTRQARRICAQKLAAAFGQPRCTRQVLVDR